MKPFYNIRRECSSTSIKWSAIDTYRSLDAALEDDEAAVRLLNNNIDANGTGLQFFKRYLPCQRRCWRT